MTTLKEYLDFSERRIITTEEKIITYLQKWGFDNDLIDEVVLIYRAACKPRMKEWGNPEQFNKGKA